MEVPALPNADQRKGARQLVGCPVSKLDALDTTDADKNALFNFVLSCEQGELCKKQLNG